MKNIFKSILALLCCGTVLASCKQEVLEVKMSVDVTSIEVVAQNPGDVSITLTSNSTWILTTPDWVTPSATYGGGDAILTFKIATNYKDATTSTAARSGEIRISGGGSMTGKGTLIIIPISQQGHTYIDPNPPLGGIPTADDLVDFAKAVNAGASISKWVNEEGHVVLLDDIDMSGIKDWTPIGVGTAAGSPNYTVDLAFKGVFDGKGHKITGISWTYDITDAETHVYGLFGAVNEAEIKNLTLGAEGDQITIVGKTEKVISVGAVAGFAVASKITGVTNNVSVVLADKNAAVPGDATKLMCLGGIAGSVCAPMEIGAEGLKVINNGEVKTGMITNEGNGGTGMTVGGIVAFTVAVDGSSLNMNNCFNYGGVSAPTGRGGGLVGTIGGATVATAITHVYACENHGLVQDDVVGQYGGAAGKHNNKRMGGLVGGTVTNVTGILVENCTNAGNVYSQIGCRTGGFIGHCQATIKNCTNKGVILAKNSHSDHGAGWACGFNGSKEQIVGCTKGGRVGDWDTYKDNPDGAPVASDENACAYKNSERYDPAANK